MVKVNLRAAIAAGVCALLSHSPAAAQTPATATIDDIMALRQLGTPHAGLALSPDRRWIAVFQEQDDATQNDARFTLLLIRSDGARSPRTIGDGGGVIWHDENGRQSGAMIDRFLRWSPDSRSVAYLKRVGDRVEVWASAIEGGARQLASLPGDIRDFAWISPGQLVVLEATPRDELAQTSAANFAHGYRLSEDLDLTYSQTPTPAVLRHSTRLVVDTNTGATRLATDAEAAALSPAADTRPAWIAARDPHLEVASPPLGLFARHDGQSPLCAHASCSGALRDAGMLSDGRVWFTRGEGFDAGDMGAYVWSPASQTVNRLRSGDEILFGCNGGDGELYCLQETPAHPRRLVAVNATSGALRVLYDPNRAWNDASSPRIERLEFTDDHGLQSYIHLIYPSDYQPGRRYPMVIVQYRSRGFLRGGTGGEYPIFAYAARGYFVMSVERPEARALSESMSPQAFDHLLNFEGEEERMKLVSLDHFIGEVARRGLVDPNAIAITGMSDGAETLYWALRHRSFAAAVASNPATDVSQYWLVSQQFRQDRIDAGIGSPWPAPAGWWLENAAALYADRIHTPLLMNLSQSEAIYAPPLQVRLRELGVPVESYLYPDAFHIKGRPSQLRAAQLRAMAWIDFWLKGEVDPDPRDPDRAERWSLMRRSRTGAQSVEPHAAPSAAAATSRQ